ncbi:hypothetical protein T439DRAFT_77385 [Meredithblackwellia eburnea MCA 4105]
MHLSSIFNLLQSIRQHLPELFLRTRSQIFVAICGESLAADFVAFAAKARLILKRLVDNPGILTGRATMDANYVLEGCTNAVLEGAAEGLQWIRILLDTTDEWSQLGTAELSSIATWSMNKFREGVSDAAVANVRKSLTGGNAKVRERAEKLFSSQDLKLLGRSSTGKWKVQQTHFNPVLKKCPSCNESERTKTRTRRTWYVLALPPSWELSPLHQPLDLFATKKKTTTTPTDARLET